MESYSHHRAWLSAHPHRSAEWLDRMVEEGFEVHHLDHNHANDEPANLVLIEGRDHMRLHGLSRRITARNAGKRGAAVRFENSTPEERKRLANAAANARWSAYRANLGEPWLELGLTKKQWNRHRYYKAEKVKHLKPAPVRRLKVLKQAPPRGAT